MVMEAAVEAYCPHGFEDSQNVGRVSIHQLHLLRESACRRRPNLSSGGFLLETEPEGVQIMNLNLMYLRFKGVTLTCYPSKDSDVTLRCLIFSQSENEEAAKVRALLRNVGIPRYAWGRNRAHEAATLNANLSTISGGKWNEFSVASLQVAQKWEVNPLMPSEWIGEAALLEAIAQRRILSLECRVAPYEVLPTIPRWVRFIFDQIVKNEGDLRARYVTMGRKYLGIHPDPNRYDGVWDGESHFRSLPQSRILTTIPQSLAANLYGAGYLWSDLRATIVATG